jgi:arylsulfatase A-like enzyme
MHMNLLYGNVTSATAEPNGNCSNPAFWQHTWPLYLQKSGYNTGIFGKAYHMGSDAPCGFAGNGYGPAKPPGTLPGARLPPWTGVNWGNPKVATNSTPLFMLPGWDRHFVYCYPLDQYFWNRWNDQGSLVGTTDRPQDYATALIGNKTVAWLREDAIPEAQKAGGKPFFAYVPVHPPHGRTTPAPWYNESWPAEWGIPRTNSATRKPNYGYRAADHHWLIAHEPPISNSSAAATQATYVQRMQMLLSVDDIIEEVSELLHATGCLENTFLLFCADQ